MESFPLSLASLELKPLYLLFLIGQNNLDCWPATINSWFENKKQTKPKKLLLKAMKVLPGEEKEKPAKWLWNMNF